TSNKVDDDSLRRVVAASMALARSQPKDPGLLPMPGPQKYTPVKRYFEATAEATPGDRARAVARICTLAAQKKQTSAGIFSTAAATMLLANSNGLFAEYRHTHAECSVTFLETDSSGWAKAGSPDIDRVDTDALAASASQKAEASRHPREVEPGRWT